MSRTQSYWGRYLRLAAVAVFVCATIGCQKTDDGDLPGKSDGKTGAAEPAGDSKAAPPSGSATDARFAVQGADGTDVVTVEASGSSASIRFGDTTVAGKAKSGKRRYETGGKLVASVKSGDGKFKLKDEAGKLLWKVKLKPDKIKISDNEEGDNAYSIKPKDGGFKVKRGDTELGKVKFYAGEGRIKVKNAAGDEVYRGKADKASAAWAVLLLSDVPEAQRYIIMAELGARGR
jgi:hypothetical protein